ncbi:hypothetical protein ACFV99_39745 [Streptomyces sp. NPDC059944]
MASLTEIRAVHQAALGRLAADPSGPEVPSSGEPDRFAWELELLLGEAGH